MVTAAFVSSAHAASLAPRPRAVPLSALRPTRPTLLWRPVASAQRPRHRPFVAAAGTAAAAAAAAIAVLLPLPGAASAARAAAAARAAVGPTAVATETADASTRTSRAGVVRMAAARILPGAADASTQRALKCALIAGAATSVVTAAVIAVFWMIQDSLVYKPTSVWRGSPKSSGMPNFDDVSYVTKDGVEITGWFIKQAEDVYRDARTLIYFHGTDKNASFRLKKVIGFHSTCGCNILLLSYRGYGLSTGSPNQKGVCIDAESAFEYLQARGDVDVSPGGKLWVFGESLGGAVAVHFTTVYEKHVNALVLENTFTSLLDMIKLEFPILGFFRYLSRNRWQSNKLIPNLSLPVMFLSGARDSYIPPAMMRKMYELAARARIREFVEFERGTHNQTWTLDGFYESIAAFMNRVDSLSASVSTPVTSPVSSATPSLASSESGEDGAMAALA
jgi:abhydrolase domain-containing protein 13